MTCAERRALWVYEAARVHAIASGAPIVPEPWLQRDEAFRAHMVSAVARQTGPDRFTTPQEAHDAWVRAYEAMGWKHGPRRDAEAKTHPDMVPFDDLGFAEQIKDRVFMDLCAIAKYSILEDADDA